VSIRSLKDIQHVRKAVLSAGAIALALPACQQDVAGPTSEIDPPSASLVAAGTWVVRADHAKTVYDAASASITNASTLRTSVYVIGGRSSGTGSVTLAVRVFDVSSNLWRSKPNYPLPVEKTNGAVELNGKIYVSGGFTRRYDATRNVYRLDPLARVYSFDPATNAWTRRQDMPFPTVRGVSDAYNGLLYVATSCYNRDVCGDNTSQGALWRYNPATDRWVLLTRTPHDPGYGAGGFIGGKLYLVEDLGAVDIYDPATKTWSSGAQRPRRFCSPASTTLQAKLYLVGCHDDLDGSGNWSMLVFDPKTNSWSEAPAPPKPANDRWALSRVVVNGKPGLELVGGPAPGNNLQFRP
jgi:N-acetylneuraminic acid mutarotase